MDSRPVPIDHPIEWWRANQLLYPKLAQMAFDLLSIPAMSAECERVFSQAKLALGPQRNKMIEATLNAMQCLKNWSRNDAFPSTG
jgi:hAT family C-terminal dimerisation region